MIFLHFDVDDVGIYLSLCFIISFHFFFLFIFKFCYMLGEVLEQKS